MKKLFLTKAIMALGAVLMMQHEAGAQAQPLHTDSTLRMFLPARFTVNTPTSIAGLKQITVASWGGAVNTPFVNEQVVKGIDSLAASALTNAAAVNGKFCLLYRGGGVNFTDKAARAQAAGARGVIIVNNVSGDPISMGGTPTTTITIPVIMVTDVVGNAINQQLRNSVAVTVTLGNAHLGLAHDLTVIGRYSSTPHALNIPEFMWSNSQNVPAYKNYIGAAVANVGTNNEPNVMVKDSVQWYPAAGGSSNVKLNSYSIQVIEKDSIRFGFGAFGDAYYLTPNGKGRYDHYTKVTGTSTDGAPEDNVSMYSQYINDSIFCKSRYDYVKGEPIVTLGIRPANGSATDNYIMGPAFFSTRGGYAARKLQFYLSAGTNVPTLVGKEATALIFKWTDGVTGNLDGDMDGDELDIVGVMVKSFGASDSSGKVYMTDIAPADPLKTELVLDSNTWYWTAIQAPGDCFLGVDEGVSYFTRAYVQGVNGVRDYPEGLAITDFTGVGGVGIQNFPFGGSAIIDSTLYDRYDQMSAVALHMSKNKVPVGVGQVRSQIGAVDIYPNPASSGSYVNVDLSLENMAERVNYRLVDAVGRFIKDVTHYNVKSEKFQYSLNGLASGNYYLIIDNGKGALLKKISVQ